MYSESIRNVSHQYWSYCSVQRQIESSILPPLRNMHSFKIWLKSCKSWRKGGRRMHLCPPTKTFYYQSSWLKPASPPLAQPFAKDNKGDFVETFWTIFWKNISSNISQFFGKYSAAEERRGVQARQKARLFCWKGLICIHQDQSLEGPANITQNTNPESGSSFRGRTEQQSKCFHSMYHEFETFIIS